MVLADLVELAVGFVPLLADQLLAIVIGNLGVQQPPTRAAIRPTEATVDPALGKCCVERPACIAALAGFALLVLLHQLTTEWLRQRFATAQRDGAPLVSVDEGVDLVVAVTDIDACHADAVLAVFRRLQQLAQLAPHRILVRLAPKLTMLEEHRAHTLEPGPHHVHQAALLYVDRQVNALRLEEQLARLVSKAHGPDLLPSRHVAGFAVDLTETSVVNGQELGWIARNLRRQ
ncbi:hypothetical protein D3C77_405600 [compost metagenome]